MLKGPALLMAVAIFAVSIHPIRHSADAKPYATDLLVALGLVALAIQWCESSERTAWLWMLVGFAPIALAASYPAVLVAVGIALALGPSVWRARRRGPKIALAAYVLVVTTTFAGLFAAIVHRRQSGAVMPALQRYWADSFPPLDSPARLTSWLITTHAGNMFAYPWGGSRGASSGTLLLVLIAAIVFWRRGRKTILFVLLMPMGVALSVAALQALSLRRSGANHAVSRPRHLPDGRAGPEHRSGLAPPRDRPSRGVTGRRRHLGRRGSCLTGGRLPTPIPGHL